MSATAESSRMQDLPPKGGYDPIQTDRIRLKKVIGAKSTIAIFLTTSIAGFYSYYCNFKLIRRQQIEMRSARLALLPLLFAERDRAVLKQMRINRDAEAKLMKNVEGWEVGTYYGEPIFFLDDPNQYREPLYSEHFAHADPDLVRERTERHLWT